MRFSQTDAPIRRSSVRLQTIDDAHIHECVSYCVSHQCSETIYERHFSHQSMPISFQVKTMAMRTFYELHFHISAHLASG